MIPYLLLLFMVAASDTVVAAEPAPDPFGQQTRRWLELQRNQAEASPHRDRLLPEATAEAKRRAVESFAHPVPERYIKPDFKE
ncbi:DUF3613 domain-containing protein [Zobellella endophytica]|uniref:DUF3613 domain-containing protein n=1 Tax=Zobellella endophytica TaxID=2116700 RepID=A0A2P7RDA1_9GAMM|nr:DUF3613 domain-containing protein [Zobellella endophytica]PSJ48132.1 DUF3613 domain-containing protein [Zobellella endophytica]